MYVSKKRITQFTLFVLGGLLSCSAYALEQQSIDSLINQTTKTGILPSTDVSKFKCKPTASSPSRTLAEWLGDSLTLKMFGLPKNSDWTAVINQAEASSASRIALPPGRYPTTLGHFQATGKTYTGPGQIVVDADTNGQGGFAEAPFRSFILNPLPDINDDRRKAFDADWSKIAPGGAAFMFVGPNATGRKLPTYRNLSQLGMSFRIYENQAGYNIDSATHAKGRSGQFVDNLRLYQGGQGDLIARSTFANIYSTKIGLKHFLAAPQIGIENGNLGAESGARGVYLQKQEYIFSDKPGTSVAAINSVMNYHRSTDADGLSQVWGHDRVQSAGPIPIDFAYSLQGLIRRGVDMTPADFSDDQAAIVLKQQQRLYWNAEKTADSLGASFYSSNLRDTYTFYDDRSKSLKYVVGGVRAFEVSNNSIGTSVPAHIGITNQPPDLPQNSWAIYFKDETKAVLTIKLGDGVQRYGVISMSPDRP